jgi:hypothetical protein
MKKKKKKKKIVNRKTIGENVNVVTALCYRCDKRLKGVIQIKSPPPSPPPPLR